MSQIHKSQVPNELLASAVAWEQLRHRYWNRPGFEAEAADCQYRRDFYQSRINAFLSEHLS